MANWEKLNTNFKTTIENLTKEDWEQWQIRFKERQKQDYEKIELTPEEVEAALLEAKKKKWFHVKHADYWLREEEKGVEKN